MDGTSPKRVSPASGQVRSLLTNTHHDHGRQVRSELTNNCILNSRSPDAWPPAEEDIRLVAATTVSGLEATGEQIARTGPPAEAGDEAVYAYLARVVAAGEPAASVLPPGEAFELPVWATAAMPVSNQPNKHHPERLLVPLAPNHYFEGRGGAPSRVILRMNPKSPNIAT
jgi:hypothetical protein